MGRIETVRDEVKQIGTGVGIPCNLSQVKLSQVKYRPECTVGRPKPRARARDG